MNRKKPLILIIEEKEEISYNFRNDHGDEYNIESICNLDIVSLKKELQTNYVNDKRPDIILCGLMFNDDSFLTQLETLIRRWLVLLEDLVKKIDKLKLPFEYRGKILLKTIREVYGKDIPIAVYTGFQLDYTFVDYKSSEKNNSGLNSVAFKKRLNKNAVSEIINNLTLPPTPTL